MARDGLSEEEALTRIRAQIPLASKTLMADVEIDNSQDRGTTRRQVEQLARRMERLSYWRWLLCRAFGIFALAFFTIFISFAF